MFKTRRSLFYFVLNLLMLRNHCLDYVNIVSRSEWGAQEPKTPPANLTVHPTKYVIVHQTSTESCFTKETCLKSVKAIQDNHINVQKLSDIKYNFLFGEDGNIYEGRGWNKKGQHATKLNMKTYGIAVIGTFNISKPKKSFESALESFLFYGVLNRKFRGDVRLVAHIQVAYEDCPGGYLYKTIKRSDYWYNDNLNIYKKIIL